MSNFNTCKFNTLFIIVIVATSLTEAIGLTLRQSEVLVNESASIICFSKKVKRIQWHHIPPGKKFNEFVYAGGRFYSPYNTGRFRVNNDPTTNKHTLVITNIMLEDAGLYECKDDVLSGVFGSTNLTVLDSSPACTYNMNPNGFVGPNTCNIEHEIMTFSCAVSFSGNSPNLTWSTLNDSQALNSSICESKDNRINCSLSMKADPLFDGSTFICQTTTPNDSRYNCSIEDIRVEYFFGDYEAVQKRVDDNVTCVVASNLQLHYNWTIQENNEENIFSANRTIYFQNPGFYKCSVKYKIRDVTCNATIVAVNVSNIVDDKETVAKSSKVSREQISIGVSIGVSVGVMCLVAIISFVKYRKRIKETSDDLTTIRSKQTYSERPCYVLKNYPRGYCIIINNFEFPGLEPRYGAVTEIVALKKLFEGLKFKVDARENLNSEQMISCLIEYRDRDHSEGDAFVCCLLSHGEKGRINATDGQIPVIKLMELFYDRSCPGLAGKPKLFFIGTCQGNGEDARIYERMQSTSAEPNPPHGQLLPEAKRDDRDLNYLVPDMDSLDLHDSAAIVRDLVPSGFDFIVSYACLPETEAWHDSNKGSLYVQALCKHLNRDLEIDVVLRNVSQEVRDLLNTYDKEDKKHLRQDPYHIITPPQKCLYLGSA